MKFFNTALLLLNAGTPIKAVSGGQPANTTQVMPLNHTSTMEQPDSLPTGGYSPIGPGPVPVGIDEVPNEEDCDDDSTEDSSDESGSSTMTPATAGGDNDDDSTMGTGAHGSGASDAGHGGAGSSSDEMDSGAPSAALPLTPGYTAMGSQTASMRPTSVSSHSGRPISTGKKITIAQLSNISSSLFKLYVDNSVLTTVTLSSSVFPPIASSANSTDGSTSDAASSSVQKISTVMAAAVAVAVMMAN
ncbi:hypothetical protein K450DRAFT_291111 [Umbelopsis ramanniana AG]|uniref:Uncharacterized protein n=1 Tax=Umbelopsis ramanniana AG TaxID=1314678 RepID=A0AAD5HHW7_UMBRA|nr:uncharacterized protein K450DRAFT_291111 [Umbelopsis ramanniana AG]KAI8583051.1 hypothetical protein K450DRAFT_291111 [Umbelopsis ramanniana AG]